MTSISTMNNTNELENTDDQRQNHTDFESFFHQITKSAMSDDGKPIDL